jgi:AcrR family transcriptional regulator
MRRQPRQARGQERIDAILEAAVSLFTEIGYDATTTNAIAQRAGARIGSLYHYFPNKEAILEALKGRMLEAMRQAYAQALTPEELTSLPAPLLIDRVINSMIALDQSNAGFMQIFHESSASTPLQLSSADVHRQIVDYLQSLLEQRLTRSQSELLSVAASMMVNTTKAAMAQMRVEPARRQQILIELKKMLSLYLQWLDDQDKPA